MSRVRPLLLLVPPWLALLVTALLVRPLLPVDETRYLSVAWEMWQRNDFLVPYLNGAPYSHKPPLLFWLFQAGWRVSDVNAWWPRLLSPLVALLNLGLTAQLAHVLWPGRSTIAHCAPWILFGSLLWVALFTLVQFDQLLVLFTLLVLLGVLRGLEGGAAGWWLAGTAIGLGALCKGPVILLHVMPAALLAPWWYRGPAARRWPRYYRSILAALGLGAGIALLWALPAGLAGGEDYRNAIFWQQTAGRAVEASAHRQPWWWYLPLLPVALLPWTIWPPLWRALRCVPGLWRETGVRFCAAWFLPALLAFSMVSGKQLKYLLPLFPALALLVARVLHELAGQDRAVRLRAPGLLLLAAGAALLGSLYRWGPDTGLPQWSHQIAPGWGVLLLLAGAGIALLPAMKLERGVIGSALTVILFALIFHVAVIPAARPAYDLSTISTRLAGLQRRDVPLANVAKYHGQYHFLGRLQQPMAAFLWDDAPAWAQRHPDGFMLVYYKQDPRPVPEADYQQPYRGGSLVLWRAQVLLDHPEWLRILPEPP